MPELNFLIFCIFLLFFSEFSCSDRVWTEFGTKIFFLSFLASLSPFWIEIKTKLTFLIFWIFLLFFSEYSCPGRVLMEFGTKIFFLFLSLSQPVLAKNNTRKRFFNFLICFSIFLGICLPGSSVSGIRDKNFFLVFSAYLIPFWLEIMLEFFFFNFLDRNNAGKRFFNFLIFFLFFLEFSCLGRVSTEFRSKTFFTLSRPILSRSSEQ